ALQQHLTEHDFIRDFWGEEDAAPPERSAATRAAPGPIVTEAQIEEFEDEATPVCCAPRTSGALADDSEEGLRQRVERLERLLKEHLASSTPWDIDRQPESPPKEREADADPNKIRLSGVSKANEEEEEFGGNKIRLSGASKTKIEVEQDLPPLPQRDTFGPVVPRTGLSLSASGLEGQDERSQRGGLAGVMDASWGLAQRWMHRRSTSANSAPPASITHVDHALQESSWDALLLLGLSDIGSMGSLMVAFGVFAAAFLQLLFCWLVSSNLLSDDDKYDLTYLREWRIYYGHSIHSYDHTSGSSLVSKVCKGRPFEREWWNNALLSEVDAYLQPVFPGSYQLPVGVVLTSMAIIIWFCFILVELDTVCGFTHAILCLPRTGTTKVEFTEFGRRMFVSISYKRLIVLCFVSFMRAFIAVALGVSAGLWLARTRDVMNILRDGVSLIFILEIDDLIYKVLVPAHAKKYMASIQKFLVKEEQQMYIFNLSSLLKLVVLTAVILILITTTLLPNTRQAESVREMICGGNRDFVYGSHPTIGPIFVTDTTEYDLKNAENMLPGIANLVEDVVFNYDPKEVKDFMWRSTLSRGELAVKHLPTVTEMQVWLDMPESQASEETDFGSRSYGTFCEDRSRDFWEGDWLWPTIETLTGATDCASAKPFCERRDLPLVRMTCPQTCGCVDPLAGLYVDNGCRQLCMETDAFQAALGDAVCQDLAHEEHELAWQRWWSGFYSNERGVWSEENEMMTFAREGAVGNCSFLLSQEWMARTFCQHRQNRPGSLICPEACGCAGSSTDLLWCPTSCTNSNLVTGDR
ncbi:unnamed protein product, partial [Symbiodinium sp. CCMP2456]